MIEVAEIDAPNLTWGRGTLGRLWYVQPRLLLMPGNPLLPVRGPETIGLRLLRRVFALEAQFPAPNIAPAFILLPEFSLHPDEVDIAKGLISNARPNTVVVSGIGQLSEEQARQIEPGADLWRGPCEGRFTNCALVGFGGTGYLYLQPKIVPSRWEQDTHWPGRVMRYFRGNHTQFIVLICSELINRPDAATTVAAIAERLDATGRALNLAIWLQHNPKPRSPEFAESLELLRRFRTTTLAVSSRGARSADRLNNFAVSGAAVPRDCLSSRSTAFTKRYHYFEPLPESRTLSRAVLLRYDADVYHVETVLACWIDADDHAAKGALLEHTQPYVFEGEQLIASNTHFHLTDILQRATQSAAQHATLAARATVISGRLAALTTGRFLDFLDVGIVPRPDGEAKRHVAGTAHQAGDAYCTCWRHRECIDRLSDEDDTAEPLAHILLALAALEESGCEVKVSFSETERTNVTIDHGGSQRLGVVFPFDFTTETTELSLWGPRSATLVESRYIILGAGTRSGRPTLPTSNAAVARRVGGMNAAIADRPALRAVYAEEFWSAFTNGTLRDLIIARLLS